MKNILRFAVYVLFCYAAFALSGAVYSFFDWIISGIMLNFCVRSRLTVPASILVLSWLVVIGPFLLLFFVERGILTLPVAGLFDDPMPLVIQCFAFVASFITVNHMTNR